MTLVLEARPGATVIGNEEKIRALVNQTGYPFQHHCGTRIASHGQFDVALEVPFTHPATVGPAVGVHGAIDILAVSPALDDRILVWLIIECKKVDAKTKNWIFFPNAGQNPRWPTFFTSSWMWRPGYSFLVTRSATFPGLGYSTGSDFNYCINGIEANDRLEHINGTHTEKIY
ncbi:hypothetical protein, partial [Frankia sp. AgB1.9]